MQLGNSLLHCGFQLANLQREYDQLQREYEEAESNWDQERQELLTQYNDKCQELERYVTLHVHFNYILYFIGISETRFLLG